MNVADGTVRKIIINDKVNSLEINTTPHQLCTYKNPDLSWSKTLYHIISLQKKKKNPFSLNFSSALSEI